MVTHRARQQSLRAGLLAVLLAAAGLVVPAAPSPGAVAAPARTPVSAAVSAHGRFVAGERLWVAGRVAGAGAGRAVKVQARSDRRPGWTTLSRGTTRAGGRYTVPVRPEHDGRLRVVVSASRGAPKGVSPAVTVAHESGARTLAARARTLGSRVGEARSARTVLTRSQRARTGVEDVRKVVQRRHAKGLLVEVTTASARRTWLVEGRILRRYLADGGPSGRWGAPTSDARCGLALSGCVQSFARGTLYSRGGSRTVSSSAATGRKGEVFAVARSQVGYVDRYSGTGRHTTRYNAWVGSGKAWCSIFLSWTGAVSGTDVLPVATSYPSFVRKVRATMPTGTTPRPGALAFVSTRPPHSEANHVLLVTSVSRDGRTLDVIHGNSVRGGGLRGVVEQRWSAANRVIFYAYPRY